MAMKKKNHSPWLYTGLSTWPFSSIFSFWSYVACQSYYKKEPSSSNNHISHWRILDSLLPMMLSCVTSIPNRIILQFLIHLIFRKSSLYREVWYLAPRECGGCSGVVGEEGSIFFWLDSQWNIRLWAIIYWKKKNHARLWNCTDLTRPKFEALDSRWIRVVLRW